MKQSLALILAVVMLFTVTACGNQNTTQTGTTTTTKGGPSTGQTTVTTAAIVTAQTTTADTTVADATTTVAETTTTATTCNHKYDERVVLKEATCASTGLAEDTCMLCNEKTTVVLAKSNNHEIVIDKAVLATTEKTGLTEGKHCAVCKKVLVAQQVTPVAISGNLSFPVGTITTETTVILTNHFELIIDPNVYVPGDLAETLNTVSAAMETVSGMKFAGIGKYGEGRIKVRVVKDNTNESEVHVAYAMPNECVISSGDIVDLYALIHEASHALQYRQSYWHHCQWAMEGISTYTTYKTQLYLQKNNPNLMEAAGSVQQSIGNYTISDYGKLYEHTMEYWMDNAFKYSGNENYSIGFRLMWFLDEVYGDYTKWIDVAEENNPYDLANVSGNEITDDQTLAAFYEAYGDDVFDKFYEWLKKNESKFEENRNTVDMRGATQVAMYPFFYNSGNEFALSFVKRTPIQYKNLCIGVAEGLRYLTEYKGKTLGELAIATNEGVMVELYDADGNLVGILGDSNLAVDLKDVSFVRLVGEGTLTQFIISGYQ